MSYSESLMDDRNEFQKKVGVGERQSMAHRVAGSNRRRYQINEHTGRVGGYLEDHWDGRVDANVFAPTVTADFTAREDPQ